MCKSEFGPSADPVGPLFFQRRSSPIAIPRAALGTTLVGTRSGPRGSERLLNNQSHRPGDNVAATAAVAGWLLALACPIQGELLPYQYGYPQAALAVAG